MGVVMEFYISLDDGTLVTPDCCSSPETNCCELEDEWNTCKATGTSNCFWNDMESQYFYWQFGNLDYVGVNDFYWSYYALYSTGTSDDGTYEIYNIGIDWIEITAIVPCMNEYFTNPAQIDTLQ
jgi:hypothetical protein